MICKSPAHMLLAKHHHGCRGVPQMGKGLFRSGAAACKGSLVRGLAGSLPPDRKTIIFIITLIFYHGVSLIIQDKVKFIIKSLYALDII